MRDRAALRGFRLRIASWDVRWLAAQQKRHTILHTCGTLRAPLCPKETRWSEAEAGAWEGRAPSVLGDVARISFVRDPDGNWIEISQRKSLTGSLA